MRMLFRRLFIIAINAALFLALLVGVEEYYRHWVPVVPSDDHPGNGLWQNYTPYVMFTTAPGKYSAWVDEFTSERIPSSIATNSWGFNDSHEFDYTKPYQKSPGERVVLFTGGSVAWGVGASATSNTIAGRMEHYLNTYQNKVKYTVINLGMGSYIAYQQFLALQLWGESFDPDWVVSMDGFNDAGVGCAYSQGVGNPMYFATTRAYILSYLYSRYNPVFYRGWAENQLILHSAAYRALTGKTYVPNLAIYDETSKEDKPGRRTIIPTKMGQSRDILAFYMKAERAIAGLYPKARVILSTQPSVNIFTGDFENIYDAPAGSAAHTKAMDARDKELEQYLSAYQDQQCSAANMQPSFTYIFVNGAIYLERFVDELRKSGRAVWYYNTGTQFPNARADRMPYFIDPAHLADKGEDLLGRFYAQRILAADADPATSAADDPSAAVAKSQQ